MSGESAMLYGFYRMCGVDGKGQVKVQCYMDFIECVE